jgi:hypothetical protein
MKQDFLDFLLTAKPLLSLQALERASGLPKNTLGKHRAWERGNRDGIELPIRYAFPIVRTMAEAFGSVSFGGWTFTTDGIALMGSRDLGEAEVTEVDGMFTYAQTQAREVWDSFDFLQFLRNDEGRA